MKIRGYRIELGEVEAALAALEGVEQAVVIAREDRPGDRRLVGYVTGAVDPAGLREQLAQRLPGYMIPAAVVVVEALPLTVNGKLDKRALPLPEYADTDRYRAPATPTEEILAGIYAEVLGLERVGVDDSFFDLGGDSILSMQVAARARAAGVLCRPRDVFVEQTVARLAGVAKVADGVQGRLMRVWGQSRRLRSCAGWPVWGAGGAVQPDDGAAGSGGVSEADVVVLVQALVDRHAMLRARVVDDGAGVGCWRCPRPGRSMRSGACTSWRCCLMRR
ncbi:AMP-binding enzyme family protein [Mycobacterium xenopi 3993]|nr:AMP-binding enzyme family protein [Mycobacterium xenopi 3993]